jgi:hypothetical protein
MKKLLLSLTALFLTFIAFSQVPANDLIENATEMTQNVFFDQNVRLDLATTTGLENPDYGIGPLNKVFYKSLITL